MLLVANMGAIHNPGNFEADLLGARLYFSGYDVHTSQELVQAAGLRVESARVATLRETMHGRTNPSKVFLGGGPAPVLAAFDLCGSSWIARPRGRPSPSPWTAELRQRFQLKYGRRG